ncbi:glycosyltransferase family 4 protein [Leucobacter insecticola]|uniref:Glycosyltransferase family 4 protein n=1 Tax=Leucobacter insecticola TaxID=2714934 RepID=A0A6G8FHP7_9MICO|nr:glycosyltransferase family 4 protein [Leucobacter insecticola]QIM15884.1 glycosyltransferase family 4 protein [Leucobacter insecticola]
MNDPIGRVVDWLIRHRSSMPRWVNRLFESAAHNPDGFVGQLSAKLLGGGQKVDATSVPATPVRVYIAAANYAAQGYRWARALEETDPVIGARNVEMVLPGGFGFPADTRVPIAVVNASAEWAASEWQAARQFTHVLIEAQRPVFGKHFNRDIRKEILGLEDAGVSVAYLSHGTDVRDPSHHAKLTPWSPYPEDPRTADLLRESSASIQLLTEMRRPTFVSTPDLIADVPWAEWCPVVIDPAVFATGAPAFAGGPVRIIHSASIPVQKGSHYIAPALAPLIESGAAEYRALEGVAWSSMPGAYAAADIVLDQFRLGSYGVAACEAMAAGRVVVGHVLPMVRERVEQDFGVSLPIVEATADTLREVIADLAADPERGRRTAAAGPAFVARVHSGRASAEALLNHWIRK